jgi:hypothetical protein
MHFLFFDKCHISYDLHQKKLCNQLSPKKNPATELQGFFVNVTELIYGQFLKYMPDRYELL